MSSIGLVSLIVACAYVSKPLYWWIGVGAMALKGRSLTIAGMIIGLGVLWPVTYSGMQDDPVQARSLSLFVRWVALYLIDINTAIAAAKEPLPLNLRLMFVVFQATAGLIAGALLGWRIPCPPSKTFSLASVR